MASRSVGLAVRRDVLRPLLSLWLRVRVLACLYHGSFSVQTWACDALDFLTSECCCPRSCINLVRRLRGHGLLFAAPVCSSWVWMSRAFRSKEHPLGDERVECVRQGNLQVARLVLVLLYASFLGCTWIVEQPMSSLMWNHPRVEWLFARQQVCCQSWFYQHLCCPCHS